MKRIQVDCALNLGWGCLTCFVLQSLGCRKFGGPFDWVMTRDMVANLGLLGRSFEDYLSEDITIKMLGSGPCLLDEVNDLAIYHPIHTDDGVNRGVLDMTINEVKDIFLKRCKRLREAMDTHESILFVRESPHRTVEDPEFIITALQAMSKAKIYLLLGYTMEETKKPVDDVYYMDYLNMPTKELRWERMIQGIEQFDVQQIGVIET